MVCASKEQASKLPDALQLQIIYSLWQQVHASSKKQDLFLVQIQTIEICAINFIYIKDTENFHSSTPHLFEDAKQT